MTVGSVRTDLTASNPLRPPAWRWERAQLLHTQQVAANNRYDDAVVRKLRKHLCPLHAADDEQQGILIDALRLRESNLVPAYLLWAGKTSLGLPVEARYELQALILAGSDAESVAAEFGIPAAAVTFYEQAFFDVRDRLSHDAWLRHAVLPGLRDPRSNDTATLWGHMGRLYGPKMVSHIAGHKAEPVAVTSAVEADNALAAFARQQMRRKLAVAALTVPVNMGTQLELLSIGVEDKKADGTSGDGPGGSTDVRKSMEEAAAAVLSVCAGRVVSITEANRNTQAAEAAGGLPLSEREQSMPYPPPGTAQ